MISNLIQIFIYIIIIDIIMSYFPQVREQQWAQTLHKIASAPQKPIRDLLPKDLPIDPAPMILIILCQVLMYILRGL